MTNEIQPDPATELSITEQIEANYANMRQFAEQLPDVLTTTSHLLHFYAVHIDENNKMDPDQDKINVQYFGAIAALEIRLARIEKALAEAGIYRRDV